MTMDCKQIDELLVDYLYQELPSAQRQAFEAHLHSCARCTEALAGYDSARSLFRELPEEEPPQRVTDFLLQEAQKAAGSVKRTAEVIDDAADTTARTVAAAEAPASSDKEPSPERKQSAALESEPAGWWASFTESLRLLLMHPAMTAAVTLLLVAGVSFVMYRKGAPLQETASVPQPVSVEVDQPAPAGAWPASEEKRAVADPLAQTGQTPQKSAPPQPKVGRVAPDEETDWSATESKDKTLDSVLGFGGNEQEKNEALVPRQKGPSEPFRPAMREPLEDLSLGGSYGRGGGALGTKGSAGPVEDVRRDISSSLKSVGGVQGRAAVVGGNNGQRLENQPSGESLASGGGAGEGGALAGKDTKEASRGGRRQAVAKPAPQSTPAGAPSAPAAAQKADMDDVAAEDRAAPESASEHFARLQRSRAAAKKRSPQVSKTYPPGWKMLDDADKERPRRAPARRKARAKSKKLASPAMSQEAEDTLRRAQQVLLQGIKAAERGDCAQAFAHFDRAMTLHPKVSVWVEPRVAQCAFEMASEDENQLARSLKTYPRLAKFLNTGMKRARKARAKAEAEKKRRAAQKKSNALKKQQSQPAKK